MGRLEFEDVSTLGELRHLLRVICEELVVYQIWPVCPDSAKIAS